MLSPREKTLLSILAVTAVSCGLCFLVLYQVELYYRDKIWADLDIRVPKHKVRLSTASAAPAPASRYIK